MYSLVDYESIFELPLAEARRTVGVMTLEEAHPDGFPTPGKLLRRLERNLTGA